MGDRNPLAEMVLQINGGYNTSIMEAQLSQTGVSEKPCAFVQIAIMIGKSLRESFRIMRNNSNDLRRDSGHMALKEPIEYRSKVTSNVEQFQQL